MPAKKTPPTILDEVQRATPDMKVARTLRKAGYTSIDEVRRDLARVGIDQADIDHNVPATLSVF